jgi:hypothetical protein
VEPDLELAGYYGFTNAADTLRLVQGGDAGKVIATASRMRQEKVSDSAPPIQAVPNLPGNPHACGTNFALDVLTAVEGGNDTFKLGVNRDESCNADDFGGAVPDTDTLTVRYADPQTSAPEAGRLQIFASRLTSRSSHLMFADGQVPGTVDDDNQVHNLVVRSYYVAQRSVGNPNVPALRVKTLSKNGTNIVFDDEEVMQGVEDFQVQFGIDTGDYNNDGKIDAGLDVNGDNIPEVDGRATRYVNPDFPNLHRYQVVSVRFWVRLRSEQREEGDANSKTLRYADVPPYVPTAADKPFRRILMSRTVTLRNARTL